MERWKLLATAAVLDAGLLLGAGLWAHWRGEPGWMAKVAWSGTAIGGGVAGALVLGGLNLAWYLVTDCFGWPGPRQWVQDWFRPLFREMSGGELLLLSAGAGLAEEAFFRGAVQAHLGWIPASLLFGLVHTGHREMIPFGAWAAVMGFFLGALYLLTDNLLAPMIAHGLYDFGALCYVRYGVRDQN